MARIAGLSLKQRWAGWDREPFRAARLDSSVDRLMSIIGMPALNVSPSTRVVDLIGRYEHFLADEVAPLEAGLAEQRVGTAWAPALDQPGADSPNGVGGPPGSVATLRGGRAVHAAHARRSRALPAPVLRVGSVKIERLTGAGYRDP